jgi:DNA-binding protein HU-beta
MNKSQLADAAATKAGLDKKQMSTALDAVLESIQGALESGEKVSLTGFGTFEVRERAARTGRNPQTGEEMQVAASKAPAFKPGKGFKDAING